jgi:DNA-directed RNA polymerase specialized sigma24 family protein
MDCQQKFAADKQDSLTSNGSLTEIDTKSSAQTLSRGYAPTLEEIWRTHAMRILRITQRITKNHEDAEDALQDSFLRAHVHLHDFDGRSSIAAWLTRIAINSALLILRKRAGAAQLSIENVEDRFRADDSRLGGAVRKSLKAKVGRHSGASKGFQLSLS